ncbi:hypothetical protein ACOMHN_061746 [Nucella lapillus]
MACVSIVFDVDSNVCQLTSTRVSHNSSNTVQQTNTSKSFEWPPDVVCENGGTLSADGQRCACPQGYYGNTCSITVADCEECAAKGLLTNSSQGVFSLRHPPYSSAIPMFCEFAPSGKFVRAVIASRVNASASFNLSWQEYREGFGDPHSRHAYWLGLEKLHQLVSLKRYTLQFNVKLVYNNSNYSQKYQNFTLGNEASGYAIGFSVPVNKEKLGDCLSDLRGAPFSTYDEDHDESSTVHCAKQHGAGWWFKGDTCSSCNPFGPILFSPEVTEGVKGQSFWKRNLGNIIPLTFRMILR